MSESRYHLGCPVWSCPGWRRKIYPAKAHQRDWLHHYSKRFNTVEGNATFYAMPSTELAKRWADQTVDGFRFALKFPRAISHDKQLVDAQPELDLFLEALEVLSSANRLGPSFLQLPPYFSPIQLESLEAFLRILPLHYQYAVEVRHEGFFEPPAEERLDAVLKELAIDRVIFDSRPLFSKAPSDEAETLAQNRKPRLPIRTQTCGRHPVLRLVGRTDIDESRPWVEQWSQQVADWIGEGLVPFVFIHTPDDRVAPEMAAMFHDCLAEKIGDLQPLKETVPVKARQLNLF